MEGCNHSTGLLSLPEEILYGHIFPQLEFSVLLRLRRVCKSIKAFSDDFITSYFKTQEREINETDATFGNFIRANIPTNRIYILNSGPEIFEDPHVPEFLELYSDKITHVRVRQFSTCISSAEYRFYSALSNLKHLGMDLTNITKRQCIMSNYKSVEKAKMAFPFPKNFKNLTTLKFNEIQASEFMDQSYPWDLINFCPQLKYLKYPLFKNLNENLCDGPFNPIMTYIKRRFDQFSEQPNLKFLDLELTECMAIFHHYFRNYEIHYRELVVLCYNRDIKLLNVYVDLHEGFCTNEIPPPPLGSDTVPLVSLINIHYFISRSELPNLERLFIKSTRDCTFTIHEANDTEPKWPNLKTIDITIDSLMMYGKHMIFDSNTIELLDFLFVDKERDGLKELAIRFKGDITDNLPVPGVQDITRSCFNVTTLNLTNWLGTSEKVSQFWEGLQLLEAVKLENCRGLEDADFCGEHVEDPSFLKLKKLKKFTLKGLHMMPHMTDLVFQRVFRHLKIKQFYLQSEQPVHHITFAGITHLAEGDFNQYVEKFPFDGWSLDGVSDDKFLQLKNKFRA